MRIGGMNMRVGGMNMRIGGMNMRIGGARMHLGITMIPGTVDHGGGGTATDHWKQNDVDNGQYWWQNGCGMRMPRSLSFQGPVCGLRLLTQGYGLRFLCQWFLRRSGSSHGLQITHHRNIF